MNALQIFTTFEKQFYIYLFVLLFLIPDVRTRAKSHTKITNQKKIIKIESYRIECHRIDNHEYSLMYFNLNFKFVSIDNTICTKKKFIYINNKTNSNKQISNSILIWDDIFELFIFTDSALFELSAFKIHKQLLNNKRQTI